jgi:hypothetical protein
MTLDTVARNTAQRLLGKFGKTCTLKRVTEGAYDTATGTASTTETSYSVKAYLDQPNSQDLAGGLVTQTDEVAIFAALGLAIEPTLLDKLTVDGTDRTIKMVSRVWSGEQVALWRVGVAS